MKAFPAGFAAVTHSSKALDLLKNLLRQKKSPRSRGAESGEASFREDHRARAEALQWLTALRRFASSDELIPH